MKAKKMHELKRCGVCANCEKVEVVKALCLRSVSSMSVRHLAGLGRLWPVVITSDDVAHVWNDCLRDWPCDSFGLHALDDARQEER